MIENFIKNLETEKLSIDILNELFLFFSTNVCPRCPANRASEYNDSYMEILDLIYKNFIRKISTDGIDSNEKIKVIAKKIQEFENLL